VLERVELRGRVRVHVLVDATNGQRRIRTAEYTKKVVRSAIGAIPCTMHDALDALAKAGRLPAQPVYDVVLVDRSILRWSFQVGPSSPRAAGPAGGLAALSGRGDDVPVWRPGNRRRILVVPS
jgi:hypothetical protein